MKLVSRVVLFAAVTAVFTFVSAENADAQLFKRLFNKGCCCKAVEPEPEPECPCEAPAPEPCPAPEPAPMPCCEPAPAPEPMPCCEPAPAPEPMPCCEPAPMPCCEPAPAPAPCCGAMLPTVGPGETLIAVYPMTFPTTPALVSPVVESSGPMVAAAPFEVSETTELVAR